MKPHALIAALLLCAPFAQAHASARAGAQDAAPPPAYVPGGRIPLLHGPIVIDGKLDDPAWQGALVQEIAYDIQPGDNTPAPVKTSVRIGYDRNALYFAFHAEDPDPARIQAHLRDRDSAFNDDWVGVFLDTFNDHRRGYELIVNPLGVQADLIRDESNTDNQEDPSWDGLWESAGRLTATGYDVEIRIPFSTLRFPRGGGLQQWGISLFRNWPRDKRHQLASHRVPRDSRCFQCEWGQYTGMEGVHQGRNLEIVPTLTAGLGQTRDAAGTPWGKTDSKVSPGLDVSWAPSPAMTLNATLNPDFSQVETDQLQVNFNDGFALFYQEKRPFFLEGADYFTTPLNVLYTRQIADPDFGLRITGRSDGSTYGALLARDATTQLLVPGVLGSSFESLDQKADVAVGRYRYDFNQHASVGVIGTFRRGEGYDNGVAGLDARWQQGGHTLSAQLLHSDSRYPQAIVDAYSDALGDNPRPSGNAWQVQYNYGNRNWGFSALHVDIDPGFRSDLGFIGQVGYRRSALSGNRVWYRDDAAFNRISLAASGGTSTRFDGQLLQRDFKLSLAVQGPMRSSFSLAPLVRTRFWNGALFHERDLSLFAGLWPLPNVRLGLAANAGRVLDLTGSRLGQRLLLNLNGEADVARGINLNWDLIHQRMHRDGGTAFTASIANLGGSWQLTPRQRLRLTLQGSNVERNQALYADTVNQHARDRAAQLVYSYKINPHTALYAGGAWGGFLDDDHPALFGDTRSVFIKLSYGWQP
ncbi:MAG: DUF5916 domain-containing protein [Thermomonas haemolytica]